MGCNLKKIVFYLSGTSMELSISCSARQFDDLQSTCTESSAFVPALQYGTEKLHSSHLKTKGIIGNPLIKTGFSKDKYIVACAIVRTIFCFRANSFALVACDHQLISSTSVSLSEFLV